MEEVQEISGHGGKVKKNLGKTQRELTSPDILPFLRTKPWTSREEPAPDP
jgi:hypothetical protein